MFALMKEAFLSDTRSKLGAGLLKPALKQLKNKLDYEEYGGAPLLGVKGISIVCHGSSRPGLSRWLWKRLSNGAPPAFYSSWNIMTLLPPLPRRKLLRKNINKGYLTGA